MIHNPQQGYETFQAQRSNDYKEVSIKLYLKSTPDMSLSSPIEQYYWAYNDQPIEPQKECEQMKYITNLIKTENIKDVRFEECLTQEQDNDTPSSSLPYINAFEKANGEPLSNYCIFNDCRRSLKKIARLLIKGLKILASGSDYFFEIGRITADTIYFFKFGATYYLTYTDMKYNTVPYTDSKRAPWLNDMHKIGLVLAQLLTQKCEFIMSEDSSNSSLEFFNQVHSLDTYDHLDQDMNVDQKIYNNDSYDKEIKKSYLNDSIYDFITKLVKGDDQFSDPESALQHQFIAQGNEMNIDKVSDILH